MERSTMPPACARAWAAYVVSLSQGKSGSLAETERAAPPDPGKGGTSKGWITRPGSLGLGLRWERLDQRVVLVDDAHLRRATGGAKVVEEVHVGVVVVLPLL